MPLTGRGHQVRRLPEFQGLDPRLLTTDLSGLSEGISRGAERFMEERRLAPERERRARLQEIQLEAAEQEAEARRRALETEETSRARLEDLLSEGRRSAFDFETMQPVLGETGEPVRPKLDGLRDQVFDFTDRFERLTGRLPSEEELVRGVSLDQGGVPQVSRRPVIGSDGQVVGHSYMDQEGKVINPNMIVHETDDDAPKMQQLAGNLFRTPDGKEYIQIDTDESGEGVFVLASRMSEDAVRRAAGLEVPARWEDVELESLARTAATAGLPLSEYLEDTGQFDYARFQDDLDERWQRREQIRRRPDRPTQSVEVGGSTFMLTPEEEGEFVMWFLGESEDMGRGLLGRRRTPDKDTQRAKIRELLQRRNLRTPEGRAPQGRLRNLDVEEPEGASRPPDEESPPPSPAIAPTQRAQPPVFRNQEAVAEALESGTIQYGDRVRVNVDGVEREFTVRP